MARNSAEPSKTGDAGAVRWSDYLDWVRAEMVRGVLGLTPEQQRTTRVPSGWTPLELLSHVLHMEQRWFAWGFLGEQVDDPWGDWDVDEPWRDGVDGRWQVADGVTAEELADRLEAVGARTREVLSSYALDTAGSTGGRFGEDPPTLEWICFHVLAEYARHAGHLDIVVELSD
ncbi:mycothiol transferase [Nocardioides bizhenqiangii]|uniref:DUF664 domain-containing protein n=1 Tax=Nocardioides bizhenqiangii TaxID=3095076 RepID=A0ABZ0ZVU6_9ACTN|nr:MULTISPECIES: DUF664 domain-containing protein [unclassified Nocardioides]MDZ5621935.1 DUF664 domain-containing protein [Nocardioides sp. HM23]WQQ27383.1 DUF664 domain-containing protein [Nocardioides sp. HM61]